MREDGRGEVISAQREKGTAMTAAEHLSAGLLLLLTCLETELVVASEYQALVALFSAGGVINCLKRMETAAFWKCPREICNYHSPRPPFIVV